MVFQGPNLDAGNMFIASNVLIVSRPFWLSEIEIMCVCVCVCVYKTASQCILLFPIQMKDYRVFNYLPSLLCLYHLYSTQESWDLRTIGMIKLEQSIITHLFCPM